MYDKLPWMNTEQYYSFWVENGGSTSDGYLLMMEFAEDYADYCRDRDGYKDRVIVLERKCEESESDDDTE